MLHARLHHVCSSCLEPPNVRAKWPLLQAVLNLLCCAVMQLTQGPTGWRLRAARTWAEISGAVSAQALSKASPEPGWTHQVVLPSSDEQAPINHSFWPFWLINAVGSLQRARYSVLSIRGRSAECAMRMRAKDSHMSCKTMLGPWRESMCKCKHAVPLIGTELGKKQNSSGISESIPAAFKHVPGRADCTGMSALCATMAHLWVERLRDFDDNQTAHLQGQSVVLLGHAPF